MNTVGNMKKPGEAKAFTLRMRKIAKCGQFPANPSGDSMEVYIPQGSGDEG
jgi:hypothetical protein